MQRPENFDISPFEVPVEAIKVKLGSGDSAVDDLESKLSQAEFELLMLRQSTQQSLPPMSDETREFYRSQGIDPDDEVQVRRALEQELEELGLSDDEDGDDDAARLKELEELVSKLKKELEQVSNEPVIKAIAESAQKALQVYAMTLSKRNYSVEDMRLIGEVEVSPLLGVPGRYFITFTLAIGDKQTAATLRLDFSSDLQEKPVEAHKTYLIGHKADGKTEILGGTYEELGTKAANNGQSLAELVRSQGYEQVDEVLIAVSDFLLD